MPRLGRGYSVETSNAAAGPRRFGTGARLRYRAPQRPLGDDRGDAAAAVGHPADDATIFADDADGGGGFSDDRGFSDDAGGDFPDDAGGDAAPPGASDPVGSVESIEWDGGDDEFGGLPEDLGEPLAWGGG